MTELLLALLSPHVTGPKFFILLGAAIYAANALFPTFTIRKSAP